MGFTTIIAVIHFTFSSHLVIKPTPRRGAFTDSDGRLFVRLLSVAIRVTMQLPVSLRTTRAARANQSLATRRVRATDMSNCECFGDFCTGLT